jgi:hypothetical protein
MGCYKNQTFCSCGCTNKKCPRLLTDDVREEAEMLGELVSLEFMRVAGCGYKRPPDRKGIRKGKTKR